MSLASQWPKTSSEQTRRRDSSNLQNILKQVNWLVSGRWHNNFISITSICIYFWFLQFMVQSNNMSSPWQPYKFIVLHAAEPPQLTCVSALRYDREKKESENSLNSHLRRFILYSFWFMNYSKYECVSHYTVRGFLNQAGSLIIWSLQNITKAHGGMNGSESKGRKYCCSYVAGEKLLHQNYIHSDTLHHSPQWNTISLTIMGSGAS